MNVHRQRSNRRLDFDYSQPGAYYVTLCAFEREPLFGAIQAGEMRQSCLGAIVENCWNELADRFNHVELDDFIVMPNHFHGIVVIRDAMPKAVSNSLLTPGSLSVIVRSFKAASTKLVRLATPGRTAPIWQRNYYDHIIRNEADLYRIRTYIRNNPANWASDEFAHR